MSVTQIDNSAPLIVTERAQRFFQRQLARQPDSIGMLIGVRKSGCSGYMYVLEPAREVPAQPHQRLEFDGLTIFVLQEGLHLFAGSTVDLVREGLNETIQFANPHAGSHCGCGESFTVDQEALG